MSSLIASSIAAAGSDNAMGQLGPIRYAPDNELILYKNHPSMISNMKVEHNTIRPFMRKGEGEPNKHYRPWLEENVGKQGVSWNWRIHSVVGDELSIDFADKGDAILFELKWP